MKAEYKAAIMTAVICVVVMYVIANYAQSFGNSIGLRCWTKDADGNWAPTECAT